MRNAQISSPNNPTQHQYTDKGAGHTMQQNSQGRPHDSHTSPHTVRRGREARTMHTAKVAVAHVEGGEVQAAHAQPVLVRLAHLVVRGGGACTALRREGVHCQLARVQHSKGQDGLAAAEGKGGRAGAGCDDRPLPHSRTGSGRQAPLPRCTPAVIQKQNTVDGALRQEAANSELQDGRPQILLKHQVLHTVLLLAGEEHAEHARQATSDYFGCARQEGQGAEGRDTHSAGRWRTVFESQPAASPPRGRAGAMEAAALSSKHAYIAWTRGSGAIGHTHARASPNAHVGWGRCVCKGRGRTGLRRVVVKVAHCEAAHIVLLIAVRPV